MNQLTTVAALPSGGGCMASLPAEVGKSAPKPYDWTALGLIASAKLGQLGYCVKDGVIERLPEEKSWGAFEPFEYTERS